MVSRTNSDLLIISDMNIHDGGEYSCEIEADQPEPISVVHTVEILGKKDSDCYNMYRYPHLQ